MIKEITGKKGLEKEEHKEKQIRNKGKYNGNKHYTNKKSKG